MATVVPSAYQPYINAMSQGTGIPASVIAAQANMESGFNPQAVSPTGAEGWLQFEPATYNSVAAQAGVPEGSEFNVADESKAYIVFMNQLLEMEGGNVFQALEAYNAGPGNLPAGAAYANAIMQNAGQSSTTQATTAGINIPNSILNLLPGFGTLGGTSVNGAANAFSGAIGNSILSALGLSSAKDLFERLGLILLGAALIIVGLSMLVKGPVVKIGKTAEKSAPEVAAVALCLTRLNRTETELIKLSID
jgi:Transglycosylase SLT domain